MGLTKEQLFKSIRKVFNYTNSVISPINEQLDQAKAKLDTVQKYQKYVNTGLDYCYLTISSTYSAQKISADDIIGFDTAKECNNMEYDLSNHTITLKQGKTYKISCNLCIVYGELQYELRDITNDIGLRLIRSTAPDSTSVASSVDCICIYTPETDCQIQIKVTQSKTTSSSSTATTPQYPTVVTDFGYFIAEEIGREIVIDPVEHMYSTDEQVVGRWIDGKPLYRKTIEFIMPSSTDNETSYNIIIGDKSITSYVRYLTVSNNIENVINMNGIVAGTDFNYNVPIPVFYNNTQLIHAYYNKKDAIFVVRDVGYEGYSAKITIEYTKTTDSATS